MEYTILKIAGEYQQSPSIFKNNLLAISADHFLKLLRTSANYLLKVFKRGENMDKKEVGDLNLEKNNKTGTQQSYQQDDESLDDEEFDEDGKNY